MICCAAFIFSTRKTTRLGATSIHAYPICLNMLAGDESGQVRNLEMLAIAISFPQSLPSQKDAWCKSMPCLLTSVWKVSQHMIAAEAKARCVEPAIWTSQDPRFHADVIDRMKAAASLLAFWLSQCQVAVNPSMPLRKPSRCGDATDTSIHQDRFCRYTKMLHLWSAQGNTRLKGQ